MIRHLLTTEQMARFVVDGFLRFDALVPEDVNRAVIADLEAGRLHGTRYSHRGGDLAAALPPALAALMALPRVRGIVASLVGEDPLHDHHAVHVVPGRTDHPGAWHQDAALDLRPHAFDIQLFWFPHDTPREMGGTALLPGSHLRRVHEHMIGGYQNLRGQLATVCPAGTLLAAHHGMWHCARPNRTAATRFMLKLRLAPRVPQHRLWDTSDVERTTEKVIERLHQDHGWYGNELRLEVLNRIRLWRHLLDDPAWDALMWLTRLENEPRGAPVPA